MKVYIIKACAKGPFKEYKKYMAAPPQSIFSLAACTPSDVDIDMVDETVDMKINYKSDADIVAIFFSTPDAIRGYEIADKFRSLGKMVVLGGLHVKFNQKEALIHCNSILVGEYEYTWTRLLIDYRLGEIAPIYESQKIVDLSYLSPFPRDIIPMSKYNYVWSVVVSRGCVNKCSYCLVNRFFEGMRYRPINDVINEIKNSGAKVIELHSDNLTADREYAMELFRRLKPLKIKWVGETTLNIADDEELLKLASESGLSYLLVGIETPSRSALMASDKDFLVVENVKRQIAKLHEYGIVVDSGMLFGFEEHDKDIFKETVEFVKNIKLDIAHGIIPIPFPGTRLYEKLDYEGKLLTKDWSKYDGRHLVYEHDNLSEEDIIEGIEYFEKETNTMSSLFSYLKFMWKMTAIYMK
ncbi:MAG: B12-binding domain-containing radical SAM protein [Firmicutes bacterium]|jgi:radical SAM superfamily enzyme YgiQ (UPF0313 family)|nr:B12-binding domain-containing radical SAM protein [Bacillota bacterium]